MAREVGGDKGVKPLRLPKFFDSLNAAQKAVVDAHLVADNPAERLVKVIKEEWGCCGDMSDAALLRNIYRYKEKFISTRQARIAAKLTNHDVAQRLDKVAAKIEKALNPIESMEKLIHMQWLRVEKLAAREEGMPTLLDSQTKNIKTLHDMVRDLAALHVDVGLLRVVRGKDREEMPAEQQAYLSNLRGREELQGARVGILTALARKGHLTAQAQTDAGEVAAYVNLRGDDEPAHPDEELHLNANGGDDES